MHKVDCDSVDDDDDDDDDNEDDDDDFGVSVKRFETLSLRPLVRDSMKQHQLGLL